MDTSGSAKEAATDSGRNDASRATPARTDGCSIDRDDDTAPPVLWIGCSDQIPDQLRAYHLVSASPDGGVALSLHDGVAYTGTIAKLSPYGHLMSRMVASVVTQVPPAFRDRARAALIDRWHREWAVLPVRAACPACDRACRDDGPASAVHS